MFTLLAVSWEQLWRLMTNTYVPMGAPHPVIWSPTTTKTCRLWHSGPVLNDNRPGGSGYIMRRGLACWADVWLAAFSPLAAKWLVENQRAPPRLSQLRQPCQILFPSVDFSSSRCFCHQVSKQFSKAICREKNVIIHGCLGALYLWSY